MPFRFSISVATLVCGVAVLSAADAPPQHPAPPQPSAVALDRIQVTATRATSLLAPGLEEARADLLRTPGGVELIAAEHFARGRLRTLNDVFALSPGVFAQSRFGSDEARISIRGSGLQRTFHGRGVRVLQDGVPVNLADGSFDMQTFEPFAAEYVRVWRGGNALAFGSTTLGGAINFVSRTGRNTPGGTVRAEAGSFGYRRALAAAGGAAGAADAFAALTATTQGSFRAHARQANTRLLANAGYRFNDTIETRFLFHRIDHPVRAARQPLQIRSRERPRHGQSHDRSAKSETRLRSRARRQQNERPRASHAVGAEPGVDL